MKVTDSEIIKSGERDLIDAITGDLNWEVIQTIFREKHNLILSDDVEYKKGDIVVHNDQIAYKLDFDIKVKVSVLFNRKGDCLEVMAAEDVTESSGEETNELEESSVETNEKDIDEDGAREFSPSDVSDAPQPAIDQNKNVARMASQIAEMISDINEE